MVVDRRKVKERTRWHKQREEKSETTPTHAFHEFRGASSHQFICSHICSRTHHRWLPPPEAAAIPYIVPSQQMCRSCTHTTSVIIIGSYTGGGSSSESSSPFTAPYLPTFSIASAHVVDVDYEHPRTQRLVARGRHSHMINGWPRARYTKGKFDTTDTARAQHPSDSHSRTSRMPSCALASKYAMKAHKNAHASRDVTRGN